MPGPGRRAAAGRKMKGSAGGRREKPLGSPPAPPGPGKFSARAAAGELAGVRGRAPRVRPRGVYLRAVACLPGTPAATLVPSPSGEAARVGGCGAPGSPDTEAAEDQGVGGSGGARGAAWPGHRARAGSPGWTPPPVSAAWGALPPRASGELVGVGEQQAGCPSAVRLSPREAVELQEASLQGHRLDFQSGGGEPRSYRRPWMASTSGAPGPG